METEIAACDCVGKSNSFRCLTYVLYVYKTYIYKEDNLLILSKMSLKLWCNQRTHGFGPLLSQPPNHLSSESQSQDRKVVQSVTAVILL